MYCKKIRLDSIKLTEEIHFEVFPYGDSGNGIAAAARRSPGYCNRTGGAASCCDRSSGAFRTAGIQKWGRSELGAQSRLKNPPACQSVGPIANLKGPHFQPSLSVCLLSNYFDHLLHFKHFMRSSKKGHRSLGVPSLRTPIGLLLESQNNGRAANCSIDTSHSCRRHFNVVVAHQYINDFFRRGH